MRSPLSMVLMTTMTALSLFGSITGSATRRTILSSTTRQAAFLAIFDHQAVAAAASITRTSGASSHRPPLSFVESRPPKIRHHQHHQRIKNRKESRLFTAASSSSARSSADGDGGGDDDGGNSNTESNRKSVTGLVYAAAQNDDPTAAAPTVTLFTKEGCTLCDKVKDVLSRIRHYDGEGDDPALPLPCDHALEQVDITDPDKGDVYDRYKYDIPVLHINGLYWTKHRLANEEEAMDAIRSARAGQFTEPRPGEPNAAKYEKQ